VTTCCSSENESGAADISNGAQHPFSVPNKGHKNEKEEHVASRSSGAAEAIGSKTFSFVLGPFVLLVNLLQSRKIHMLHAFPLLLWFLERILKTCF